MPRSLPTDQDILEACTWRLSGASQEQIVRELNLTRHWLEDRQQERIAEDDPTVTLMLAVIRRTGDTRKPWGLLMALVAVDAFNSNNFSLFYRAGYEVLQIHAQASKRLAKPRGRDDLNQLIEVIRAEHPDSSAPQIVEALAELAGNYNYSTLADYDADTGILTYQPSQDDEALRDISSPALLRRIQRISATVTG